MPTEVIRILILGLSIVSLLLLSWTLVQGWPPRWRHRCASHQVAIRRDLPKALDLMRLCLDGGLSVEEAIERTGREMASRHPDLHDELQRVAQALHDGAPLGEALRDLALRVGLAEVDLFVAALVQTQRLGLGRPEALRVCAQRLRVLERSRPRPSCPPHPLKARGAASDAQSEHGASPHGANAGTRIP